MQTPENISKAIEQLRLEQNVFRIMPDESRSPSPDSTGNSATTQIATPVLPTSGGTPNVRSRPRVPPIETTAREVSEATHSRAVRVVSYQEMFKESKDAGFKAITTEFWKGIWRDRRDLEPEKFGELCGPEYAEAVRYNNELRAKCGKPARDSDPDTDYVLITVNPRDGTPLDSLLRLISKCISKTWICDSAARWLYVIEQRSTDSSSPRGIHAHILLERPRINGNSRYPWSKFRTEITNTFKSLIGGGPQRHLINFMPVRKTLRNVINYMLGYKEEGKMEAQTATEEWRNQIGLAAYFTNMEDLHTEVDPPSARSDEDADDEDSDTGEDSEGDDDEDSGSEIEELN